MTNTTPGGLPYPDPTDPLSDGANAIRRLAEAVDPRVADSGWVTLAPASGYTAGEGLGYRRIGKVIYLRGRVVRTAGAFPTGFTQIATLPAAAWPEILSLIPCVIGASTNVPVSGIARIESTNGALLIGYQGTTSATDVRLTGVTFVAAN